MCFTRVSFKPVMCVRFTKGRNLLCTKFCHCSMDFELLGCFVRMEQNVELKCSCPMVDTVWVHGTLTDYSSYLHFSF